MSMHWGRKVGARTMRQARAVGVLSKLARGFGLGLGLIALASCGQGGGGEKPQSVDEAVTASCTLGQECCPAGYQTVTLTNGSDQFTTTKAKQCVVALAGSDVIAANSGDGIVLAGDGDDIIMAGPHSTVRGGNGRDTINVWGGPATVYGGPGDDTINAANGDNFVVPGPGRDTVALGTGNDTVALYDLCEITGGGKTLDGGTGTNTLITPVPLAQLRALGVTVSNFQNIVVQSNSCRSECVTQPDCSSHGACVEGATSGQVQCKCDLPYQGATCNIKGCVSQDDTDHDLVLDCLDGCPYDPLKTAPGLAGCGVPETDTDHDGTPDAIEQCPNDPNNTTSGECGCVGERTLKPAGTPCNDTACPLASGATATCNGAGVCGDRSSCVPGSGCRFFDWRGSSFWACGTDAGANGSAPVGQLSQTAAAAACDAKGLSLVRIDSPDENTFLAKLLKAPIWLGANDISVANSWRWSTAKTKDGDPFWSGGANGARVGGRFAFWNAGAPAANRCATMRPGDGRWIDSSCTEVHGYMCSFPLPLTQPLGPNGKPIGTPPPGILGQPPALTNCVPETESGLPGSMAELTAEVKDSGPTGASAHPPTSGACPPEDPANSALGIDGDAGNGCQPTEISNIGCFSDAECVTKAGPGFLCRQKKDDVSTCHPPDAGTAAANGPSASDCRGHAVCMKVTCPADQPPCDQINICNPGTEVDAGLDPGAQLDAGAFQPSGLFSGTLPDASPTGTYIDLPTGIGIENAWCKMAPEKPVPPANQAPGGYTGNSGGSSAISFKFDPDLVFDVTPSALALGETDHVIHAQARLGASVHLNKFLGQTFTGSILDASIGILVNRCSINDTRDTSFKVLGLDLISADQLGVPLINSDDITSSCADPSSALCALYHASDTCEKDLVQYKAYANRAKKAFRDAQQLLNQYYLARKNGHTLAANLCHQLGVDTANVPAFPGGNFCPTTETPEATINRFVDYYQSTGNGQLSLFRQIAGNLTNASVAFAEKFTLSGPGRLSLQFGDSHGEESQTILNIPFAIGPVPMVLQVDVFAQYGVSGNFALDVEPPVGLEGPANVEQTVAKVDANVVPYASAGLSAFVGAGIDIGPIAATIGLEGAVTLADLKAPIFAGAGVKVAVTQDVRPLPVDIQPPVATAANAFVFGGGPKSFKYSVFYDYGAGVDLDNILSGALNGRLRIRFAFFSRTWRKQIVKFDGWSQHIDLVHGGSDPSVATGPQTVPTSVDTVRNTTQVASGQNAMGLSEPEVPLMQLASLTVPSGTTGGADAGTGTSVDFDPTALQSVFYDRLCCVAAGGTCEGEQLCCPGSTCQIPPDATLLVGTCTPQCEHIDQGCKVDNDCCNDPPTSTLNRCITSTGRCEACFSDNSKSCTEGHDCCSGLCSDGACQASPR
jgi:hypothetical protein